MWRGHKTGFFLDQRPNRRFGENNKFGQKTPESCGVELLRIFSSMTYNLRNLYKITKKPSKGTLQ